MGRVFPYEWEQTIIKNDKGKELPIMNFKLKMQSDLRDDIYDYILSGDDSE